MSIVENLNRIKSCKESIKQAIINKGVDMTDIPFEGYAAKIAEISGGGEPEVDDTDYVELTNLGNVNNEAASGLGKIITMVLTTQDVLFDTSLNTYMGNGNYLQLDIWSPDGSLYTGTYTASATGSISGSGLNDWEFNIGYDVVDWEGYNWGTCWFEITDNATTVLGKVVDGTITVLVENDNLILKLKSSTVNARFTKSISELPFTVINNGGGEPEVPADYLEYKSNLTSYSSETTEIPEAAFYGCTSLATVNLPNIGNIPAYAFRRCSGLTSVNAPSSGNLEPNAFEGCTSLTAIDLPLCTYMNPDCFRDCTSLATVNLPLLQTVGSYGFYNCTSLTAIDLPNCNYLQNDAFSGCNNLASVNLPNCLEIQSNVFDACASLTSLDLPNCEKIDMNGLANTALTSVSIPKCKEIGSSAFAYDGNLTSITATDCEMIHDSAFQFCGALTSIELPNCTGISSNAFWSCSSLASVSIPNCGVISNGAFVECNVLSELDLSHTYYCRMDDSSAFNSTPLMNGTGVIKVHKSVLSQFQSDEYWSAFAALFVGVGEDDEILLAIDSDGKVYGETFGLYDGYLDYLGVSNESVISIDLPNVVSIYSDTGMGMFAWYPNLQTVKLPKVKQIDQPAFSGCGALTSVELPNCTNITNETFAECFNLQTVDLTNCDTVLDNAFRNCVNMKSVELPNCTYISSNAFENCMLLESVSLPNCNAIGMNVFANCTNLKTLTIGTNNWAVCGSFGELNIPESVEKIYVNPSYVDSYKSDWAWGQYADKIFAAE